MRTNLIDKKFQLKMIKEKQITNIKIRTKIDIKIKLTFLNFSQLLKSIFLSK
jgi:hypothetical protein